jgi:PfaD family protein
VKEVLAETAMADVTMAPCADMFESGAKVEVIKKKTMYAQNAAKLYEYYVKYPSFEAIPQADRDLIEKKILKDTFDHIWTGTKEYFSRVDPSKIPMAEKNPKMKMALVFRWYLGSSSRWAVQGTPDRKFDMQIWCGQAMGAFNLWVKGTKLEKPENRHVGEIAQLLLSSGAYHYMKNMLTRMGADPAIFQADILEAYLK